jgi:thiamine pyrophosphate-dependent acetolactate synthase large subunit-like protein/nitrite reductase/ring-hydroxylating ferredoxin subunit
MSESTELNWHKAIGLDELPEGRVKTVTLENQSFCVTHYNGQFSVLDNRCPHQGGPLGEGSIENGLLRCPWHGWDYCPHTGNAPGFDDGVKVFPSEERGDGVYVGLEAPRPHVRTITDVMAETMVNWGVSDVFGMVGHSNLGLADAIRRLEVEGKLRFFGVRHEGAAAFACSAYAKLTGNPAACFTIAGPGATNLLTGLWDAKVDRAPVLALTGQVDAQVLGPGAFQEVDLASAFESVAAWSQTVLHSSKHAELATLALKHAILKRDVAHLIFPDEVQTLPANDAQPSGPEGRIPDLRIAPPEESLRQALDLIRKSKRPVIIIGHGARFHKKEIIDLAEKLNAPILTTFKGKGIVSDAHPLACGVLGRSGTPIASYFMNESDALIVLGASFSNHTGITPKRPTIQVDFDPLALGKFHPVTVPVLGEIGVTANLLIDQLDDLETVDQRPEIAQRWEIWCAEKSKRELDDQGKGVNSASIFAAMNRHVPADAVIAVDVGNNAYSFGRYFEAREHAVLMSGYLGSIGFGYPAAMGAWAAEGDKRPIVAVTGDGGFGQYMGELLTAVKYGMNIKHILINNGELGKISKEQRAGEFDVWQTTLHNPNFATFAEDCGALGIRVTNKSQLDDALKKAFQHNGPAMIEVMADAELV